MDADDKGAQAAEAPATGDPSRGVGSAGTDLDTALLAVVLERGYERRDEPFALSSGGYSRDYVDLRRAVARGPDLDVAARALVARLAGHRVVFDVIGGLTMGADPVAHAVALISGTAWFSVRKAAKDHGRQQRVEGATLRPGVRAVVMEDTVSTGRSLLEAYDVVASTGATIVAACTLLDRGGDMGRTMTERGTPYIALLSHRDLGIDPVVPAPA
jgi:orotate phosphoribosyltransferase